MSFLLGEANRRASQAIAADDVSPPAARATARRLRDPRLWVGVLIVAVCALIGARVLSAADDTVEVWAAARDLPAGASLDPGDIVSTSIRLDDPNSLRAYLPTATALTGRGLAQPVGAGELIPSSAVADSAAPTSELPIGVAGSDLPADLSAGDDVDVWAAPTGDQGEGRAQVRRLLSDVRVAAVAAPELIGVGGDREVVLAVDTPADVATVLGGLAGMRPVLVRVGG
jgi:hypothetical protein